MSKPIYIFLALFICATLSATAAGKRPLDVWNFYYFDGTAFKAGQSSDGRTLIAVREKVRPVVLTAPTSQIEQIPLPEGTGVIAGISYVQNSGGKLADDNKRYTTHPHTDVQISSSGRQPVTVRTDNYGYFVAVLPVGVYFVSNGPFNAQISVERGITTLVPLRAGKRMAD